MKTIFNHSAVSAGFAAFTIAFSLIGSHVSLAAGPPPVNLSSAADFTVLAKTGISTTGSTRIAGDIGVSPAAGTSITGFGLSLPAASPFSTSPLVTGKIYAPDYASPTPVVMTAAIGDMQTAYTDGAGRTDPTATELGAGNIGGLTIAPGIYAWGTGVTIPTDVTLSGSSNDVWIFQIAQTLTVGSGVHVVLSGGAQAGNVFWIVAGQTTIGTTANFSGNILDKTAIVLNTGATLNGRALAQTAVTLDSNEVTAPSGSSSNSNPAPASVSTPNMTSSPASNNTALTASPSMNGTSNNNSQTYPGPYQYSNAPAVVSAPSIVTMGTNAWNPQYPNILTGQNLTMGDSNQNVAVLQGLLSEMGYLTVPPGVAFGYYGTLTRNAVVAYQASVHVSPAVGYYGPLTKTAMYGDFASRGWLNMLGWQD